MLVPPWGEGKIHKNDFLEGMSIWVEIQMLNKGKSYLHRIIVVKVMILEMKRVMWWFIDWMKTPLLSEFLIFLSKNNVVCFLIHMKMNKCSSYVAIKKKCILSSSWYRDLRKHLTYFPPHFSFPCGTQAQAHGPDHYPLSYNPYNDALHHGVLGVYRHLETRGIQWLQM